MREQPVRMLRCPNCGALYKEGLKHCPYCRSVDDYQDESEYLEDLDEFKERADLPPEARRNILWDNPRRFSGLN